MKHTRAFWFTSHNYGDNLNHYILSRISKNSVVFAEINDPCKKIVAIGTILNWCDENSIAWGAGLGDRTHFINPAADVRAVRGPLTRKRVAEIGIDIPEVYGDPALLMPFIYTPPVKKRYRLGIIPHYVDQIKVFDEYEKAGKDTLLIDILDTPERVTDAIASCEYIISSSLHGIIVAHAYNIPAAWVHFTDKIGGDGMKYHDHFATMGAEVECSINLEKKIKISEIMKLAEEQFAFKPKFDPKPLLKAAPFELIEHLKNYCE